VELKHSPDPLAAIGGLLLKREGKRRGLLLRGGRRKEGEGGEGRGRRKGGENCPWPAHFSEASVAYVSSWSSRGLLGFQTC